MVTNDSISDHDESELGTSNIQHLTPPEQLIMPEGLIGQVVNPRQPRQPHQERDPQHLQDVVTQQTEILARMMAELRARQPAAQPANRAETPEDPAFDWTRLALPSETNFQVLGTGLVQRMASSLFARVPTLAGRDKHEARFVLQVISLWPDLRDAKRTWAFQRLNVNCIGFGMDCGYGSECLINCNHRFCPPTGRGAPTTTTSGTAQKPQRTTTTS